jgi:hypothetical protein
MSNNATDPDRAPAERPPSDERDTESFTDLLQQPGSDEEGGADGDDGDEAATDAETGTASPMAEEVASLSDDLANAREDASLDVDTSPSEATTDEGETMTGIYAVEDGDVRFDAIAAHESLGEPGYTLPGDEQVSERVRLEVIRTDDDGNEIDRETITRAKQPPEATVRDWAALIRNGPTELGDVEARPYQDWSDAEMQERVDAELRGGRE